MIKIGKHEIGLQTAPFVIAEMSGNHNQSLERALEIVDKAADAGADAIKLQTYTADTMTIEVQKKDFIIDDEGSLWKGHSLYDLYEEAHTPWEWHEAIFERCKKRGIEGFSSPFDESAVDFLDKLGVPAFKIASFENTDVKLLRKVASKKKPVIVSTGMATLSELDEMVRELRTAGCHEIILLKCTSTYPASPVNSNLATIPHLRSLFDLEVGLSDHTLGIGVSIGSVVLGATVIERHFTLDRKEGGVDSAFSLEPAEMKSLVEESHRAWRALGKIHYGPVAEEKSSMRFRRSLYVVRDIKAGERLTTENLRAIRPGYGLPVKYFDTLIGKQVTREVTRGTPASWDLIK